MSNLSGDSAEAGVPAVKGEYTDTGETYVHDGGKGVQGYSKNGYGVHGISEVGRGVVASSQTNYGLRAHSNTLSGARCSSDDGTGVEGEARGAGTGVRGTSQEGNGIHGISVSGYGLRAHSNTLSGARCSSDRGTGVEGEARDTGTGVVGTSTHGIGVYGKGGRLAGSFEGPVDVTGPLTVQGKNVLDLVQQLQQRITKLEALRSTHFGSLIENPATRPNIVVAYEGWTDVGDAVFTISGSGFPPVTWVEVHFFNTTHPNLDERHDQPALLRNKAETDRSGAFSGLIARTRCERGDRLKVVATDRRRDFNDFTTSLWSNVVEIVVS